MALIADTRRWIVDQIKQDEYVNGSPKAKVRALDLAIVNLTPVERKKQLEHAKAYTDYYYQGFHREQVPMEVRSEIRRLERQVERLNTVDMAREVLQKLGGAPTLDTIAEALHRSVKQRDIEASRGPEKHREAAYEQSVGM